MDDETVYRQKVQQDFIEVVNKLIGIPCVGFKITEGKDGDNGYVALQLGNSHAIENETPDYILLVACLWRIETPDTVLGTFIASKSGTLNKYKLLALMQLVVNNKVEIIEITQPSFDLKITFSGKFVVRIMVGGAQGYTNYRLFDLFASLNGSDKHGYDVQENERVDYMPTILPE